MAAPGTACMQRHTIASLQFQFSLGARDMSCTLQMCSSSSISGARSSARNGSLRPSRKKSTLEWGGGRGSMDGFNDSKFLVVANAEKKKISFGDQLLDYIEGGPKLRKWYGAPDKILKPGVNLKKEETQEPEDKEEAVIRDVVLVTDADSETGQLVVLELILRRLRVRALVKDLKAATAGFGAYVEPVQGDVNDKAILRRALRGVRAIICPTKVGELADTEMVNGVEHIVLLSKLPVNRNPWGLGSLFGSISGRDAEENEAAISSLGIPYTFVRAGSLKDEPGAQLGFRYGQGGDVQGTISREDAAFLCVEALESPPRSALIFEVVNGKEEVDDWSAVFTSLKETTPDS